MQFLETEQSAHILPGLQMQAAWCVSLALLLLLGLFNDELFQERYWQGPIRQEIGEGGAYA